MSYPRCGTPADVAFVLSLDVERKDGEWRIAPSHLQSGYAQLAHVWLPAVAALITTRIAKTVVIVGGHEARYPSEMIARPEILRELVLAKYDIPQESIETAISAPNTSGNADAIRRWGDENSLFVDRSIVACCFWHAPRATLSLEAQGRRMPIIPLEAVWLATSADSSARRARSTWLADVFGGSELAKRIAGECNGIADALNGAYVPLSDREALVAAQ